MKEKFLKWSENAANHKHALHWLFFISFIESSLSPFPVYFLILFILVHKVKHSWKKVAFIATLASVLGGIFGYIIGFYFYKMIGQPIIEFYNLQEQFTDFGNKLRDNSIWILILAGMSPLPYKVITITSGVFAINFPLFVLISIISRGIKYITVSYVTEKFGMKMKEAMFESFWVSIFSFIIILFLIYFFFFN